MMLIMATKGPAVCRVTTIRNELGLHARSAAQIAAIARNSATNVWIMKGDQRADASSIMDILTLTSWLGCQET